jgi:putative endonuclease
MTNVDYDMEILRAGSLHLNSFVMAAKAATHDKLVYENSRHHWAIFSPLKQGTRMAEWWYKVPCVYLMASKPNGVLYIGVTSALHDRVQIHKHDLYDGFTKKYQVHRLVYYEVHETMDAAIQRETRMKHWQRAWKVRLIHQMNPEWIELFDVRTGEILDGPAATQWLAR